MVLEGLVECNGKPVLAVREVLRRRRRLKIRSATMRAMMPTATRMLMMAQVDKPRSCLSRSPGPPNWRGWRWEGAIERLSCWWKEEVGFKCLMSVFDEISNFFLFFLKHLNCRRMLCDLEDVVVVKGRLADRVERTGGSVWDGAHPKQCNYP